MSVSLLLTFCVILLLASRALLHSFSFATLVVTPPVRHLRAFNECLQVLLTQGAAARPTHA